MIRHVSILVIWVTLFYCSSANEPVKCNLWQGKCPPGWKTFVRPPSSRLCLRIFRQNATYLEAQDVCRKQYNSRIHGVENVDEHSWLKMKAKKVITDTPGYMWVGARRKSYCYKTPADLSNDPLCNKKTEMFKWDDQVTKGSFLFTQWDQTVDAPNGIMSNNAPEDCVVMNVNENAGYIDDKDCSLPQPGFLCGMSA